MRLDHKARSSHFHIFAVEVRIHRIFHRKKKVFVNINQMKWIGAFEFAKMFRVDGGLRDISPLSLNLKLLSLRIVLLA